MREILGFCYIDTKSGLGELQDIRSSRILLTYGHHYNRGFTLLADRIGSLLAAVVDLADN